MDDTNLQRRKELSAALLAEFEDTNRRLTDAVIRIEKESGIFYEKAFMEKEAELKQEAENHKANIEKIGQLNTAVTAAVNSWYEFTGNGKETGRLLYPIVWHHKRRKLLKTVARLNAEVSDTVIKNRFIAEKLTNLEHQLEIQAMTLAKSGVGYQEYENLLQKRELIAGELKYLLSSIPQL